MTDLLRFPSFASTCVLLLVSALVTSCDQPSLQKEKEAAPPPVIPAESASTEKPETTTAENKEEVKQPVAPPESDGAAPSPPEEPEAPEKAAPPQEPLQPEIEVVDRGGLLHVSGAIRSQRQHDRILEQLATAFPERSIEDHLEVDVSRIPVGWGNRVTETFLVPFFAEIEGGSVRYSEGIIYIDGTATKRGQFRQFQLLATEAFRGDLSRDIENNIKEPGGGNAR